MLAAKVAASTGNRKGDNNPFAYLEAGFGADLHHFAHELVADDVTGLHGWDYAIVEVQIRSTNRG